MPNRKRQNRRRAPKRQNRRRLGSSQRFANRRNVIRVALKVNPTSKDLYYIPLTDLVPLSEPLPETDEQLHKISCNVTIVTNNNVTGCSYQMGIAGDWVFDENVESNDFLPLTTPKMLKSNRPTRCLVGIPEPTRHAKGVLRGGNSLAIKVYPACDGQVNSGTLIISTNSVFKLAIKEPQPVDVGTLLPLQSMRVSDSSPAPPANFQPVPKNIINFSRTYTANGTSFPLDYIDSNDLNPGSFTVQGSGSPIIAGVLDCGVQSNFQTQFDSQGYVGTIVFNRP